MSNGGAKLVTPGIGPHEGRELELLLAGEKPMAMLVAPDERFERAVASGVLVRAHLVTAVTAMPSLLDRLAGRTPRRLTLPVYLARGEEWRAVALQRIYDGIHARKGAGAGPVALTDMEHAVIGELLGYADADIAAYLDYLAGLEQRADASEVDTPRPEAVAPSPEEAGPILGRFRARLTAAIRKHADTTPAAPPGCQ